MKRVVVFTDTNGFIQLKDLKDLPWRELFPGVEHVAVIVARPVVSELDKHKVSTNARRRDRARAALKLIDEATAAAERTITLRQKPLLVTLAVAPRAKPDWESLSDLDPNEPDDQLVAAVLTFGEDAVLLSHDSGPRISARDVGLTAHEPRAAWLLPAEQSDDQRKIGKLERQLKEVSERAPQIEISFPDAVEGRLVLSRPRVPCLDKATIEELSERYIAQHPRKELTATISIGGIDAILSGSYSQEEVEKYCREYDEFLRQVPKFFGRLHERVAQAANAPEVAFNIFNAGGASTEQLKISMQLTGDLGLLARKADMEAMVVTLALPGPPSPPKRTFPLFDDPLVGVERLMGRTVGLNPLDNLHRQDPTEMRWIDRPAFRGKQGSYGCQDFRPKRRYGDRVWLAPLAKLPLEGRFTVTASANHMAEVSAAVDITIQERDDAWLSDSVLALLPEFVRNELKKRP